MVKRVPREPDAPSDDEIPTITEEQIRELDERMKKWPREPLDPTGTVTECHNCGGRMITTNALTYEVPTPRGLVILTRLPGAQCGTCHTQQFDAGALAIIAEHEANEVIADYETKVTTAGGGTLGTYFKTDLVRVLGLRGKEKLRWKIVGRGKALVEVER